MSFCGWNGYGHLYAAGFGEGSCGQSPVQRWRGQRDARHIDFEARWAAHRDSSARWRHRQRGGATYRLVRYAEDFVVMVHGQRHHAEAMHGEVADLLEPLGLRMVPDTTRVVHIDEGFDFLGFRIQRRNQWGGTKRYVYTVPSEQSVVTIRRKIKKSTRGSVTSPRTRCSDASIP